MLVPFFDFFKKKTAPKKKSDIKFKSSQEYDHHEISVEINQEEIKKILADKEKEKLKILSSKLHNIRDFAKSSIMNIKYIISELEKAKIEVEEVSFDSIVKNSKRTVISSIKKEFVRDLPTPNSYQEITRLQERLSTLVKKFNDLSSSHGRVFNVFIKKHTGRLKTEFKNISILLEQTDHLIDKYDEETKLIKNVRKNLELINNNKENIKYNEKYIKQIEDEFQELDKKIKFLKTDLKNIELSEDYIESQKIISKIKKIENDKKEYHKDLVNNFSRVGRAFNKYSYGLSKDVNRKIEIMLEKPWEIFKDLSSYKTIIVQVQKDILNDKIDLKDSQKIQTHLTKIIESLDNFKNTEDNYIKQINQLRNDSKLLLIKKRQELNKKITTEEENIEHVTKKISNITTNLESNKSELEKTYQSINNDLFEITNKKYELKK
ncbi:MAG: hypothetical protein ACPKPY_06990 [Nitrososphaeraceae archaeon]